MSDDDLTLIPSHNLDCERDLAISGIHIENTSKCSNRSMHTWQRNAAQIFSSQEN